MDQAFVIECICSILIVSLDNFSDIPSKIFEMPAQRTEFLRIRVRLRPRCLTLTCLRSGSYITRYITRDRNSQKPAYAPGQMSGSEVKGMKKRVRGAYGVTMI